MEDNEEPDEDEEDPGEWIRIFMKNGAVSSSQKGNHGSGALFQVR